jgi:NAD(P)-dependent dehydrogenase (short-subunit alcohol dehydrogenase family)
MNTDRFSGKSILITGGAGGLGSQIARSVIAQGGKVGILDTNADAIQTLVTELTARDKTKRALKLYQRLMLLRNCVQITSQE